MYIHVHVVLFIALHELSTVQGEGGREWEREEGREGGKEGEN